MNWSGLLISALTQIVSKLLASGVFERILAEVQSQWSSPLSGEDKRVAVLNVIKTEFGAVAGSLINLGIEVAVVKIKHVLGQ